MERALWKGCSAPSVDEGMFTPELWTRSGLSGLKDARESAAKFRGRNCKARAPYDSRYPTQGNAPAYLSGTAGSYPETDRNSFG